MYGNDIDINKLKTVQLSDITIAHRIDFFFFGIRCESITAGWTDVSKDAQLLAFVRFLDQNEMH